VVMNSGPVKAYLETEQGGRIDCLFNPAELQIRKSNRWFAPAVAGRNAPNLIFQRGEAGTLSMTLWFDTTDSGKAVTEYTSKLLDLMKVDPSLGDTTDPQVKSGRPPWVRFNWGQLNSFKAILNSLDITFTYFASTGVPLRARASVSLQQFADEGKWPLQNPTSGTPSPHTVHQVLAGETLDRIAARHYGDAGRWRTIAEANAVLDPLRVTPGTLLVIPQVEAVARA
jgi:hypothetical protein